MPSAVASLFAAAGIASEGAVHWGTPIPQSASGVYVVALTEDPAAIEGTHDRAPLRKQALESLLDVRPALRLDERRPRADELAARLASYWLADETAVYVGLATSLRGRVRSYYRTPLGAKRPHSGGWWLKTLAVLDELWVHYTPTLDFKTAEKQMLAAFAAAVSRPSREALPDQERVTPFANLRGYDDLVKRHGITGATGDLH